MIRNFWSYSTDIYLPSPMGIVADTGLSWEQNKVSAFLEPTSILVIYDRQQLKSTVLEILTLDNI